MPHDQFFQQTTPQLHGHFTRHATPTDWDEAWHIFARPIARALSPGHYVRMLTGGIEALDANCFGQVPDSPWFVNRIGRTPMTREEIRRGPDELPGPADGPLLVIGAKTGGATPGLHVRDQRGVRWLVKFDMPVYPDLLPNAEIVGTKLLHAAGYHVPENHRVELALQRLKVAANATTRDRYNRRVPFTSRDLTEQLAGLSADAQGRVRTVFSRFVPGRVIGPCELSGTYNADPNDTIPHEHRRSLRGLWVFLAWINNHDIKKEHLLDTFIPTSTDPTRGYVKHYVLDFGASLGAEGVTPKAPISGYAHHTDLAYIARSFFTFGLVSPYWSAVHKSPFHSVGVFEGEVFDPARWRPMMPTPAFEQATVQDTYWAASILFHFSPELIAAAVETADYSEPGAAAWVREVLQIRREKLLRYAFSQVLALDHPRMISASSLELTDLEATARLVPPCRACYRWSARWNRTGARDVPLGEGVAAEPRLELKTVLSRARGLGGTAFARDPFLTVTFSRMTPGYPRPTLEVHLRATSSGLLPVGMHRRGTRG